jgi:hypothetical protein
VKKHWIISSAILCACFLPPYQLALANSSYYLEIGKEVSQAQAEKNWHTLASKHKTLLKGLWYYPKTVLKDNNDALTLIQAGPVKDKATAQKICNTLFATDISSFVIEDLDRAPPSSVASLGKKMQEKTRTIQIVSDSPAVLPWHDSQPREEMPESKKEDNESFWSFLPSIDSDNQEPSKPTRQEYARQQNVRQEETSNDDNDSMWSWLDSDDKEDKKTPAVVESVTVSETEPAPVTVESRDLGGNAEADVEVGEAIRVPLSEGRRDMALTDPSQNVASPTAPTYKTTTNGLPAADLLDHNPVVTTPEVQQMRLNMARTRDNAPAQSDSGWLDVSYFNSESEASQAWQRVRGHAADKASSLRVRIVRPLVSGTSSSTSMQIGPFASGRQAMDFCDANIRTLDSALNCRFSSEGAGVATANTALPAPSGRYEQRAQATKATGNAGLESAAGKSYANAYWVDVVTGKKNQGKALNAWEDLRTTHSDLFASKPSNLVQSESDGKFVVRVGPLASNKEAFGLCNKLKKRDVNCMLVKPTQQ